MPPSSKLATASVMVAWTVFGLGVVIGRVRAHQAHRPGTPVARDRGALIGFALQAGAFALVFNLARAPGSQLVPLGEPGQWLLAFAEAAMALGAAGLALWAIRTLGRQYAFTAQAAVGHELVTGGPFAFVRNPVYLAMGVLLLASGLAVSRGWPTVLGLMLYAAGTYLRVGREEAVLRVAYGEAYADYVRQVPRLLPWPRHRRAA